MTCLFGGENINLNKGGKVMDPIITNYLSRLEFGEIQVFKNMTVIPLLTSVNHGPEYICLDGPVFDYRHLSTMGVRV